MNHIHPIDFSAIAAILKGGLLFIGMVALLALFSVALSQGSRTSTQQRASLRDR